MDGGRFMPFYRRALRVVAPHRDCQMLLLLAWSIHGTSDPFMSAPRPATLLLDLCVEFKC